MGDYGDVIHETRDDSDSGWYLPLIYANPDDPRLIVPRRPRWLGWTVNLGQPGGWLVLAVLVLLGFLWRRFKAR